jgi:hypothetical protein
MEQHNLEPQDEQQASPAPSGDVAGGQPANPTPGSSSGTVPEESPADRFERLKALIFQRRQQQAIEDMERELAGEEPAFRATIPDFTLAQGQKRPASPSMEDAPRRRPSNCPKTPPTFSGKDIAELDTFDVAFRAYFEATGLKKTPEQIQLAATYLTDNPQKAWARKRPDLSSMTWDKFIVYLKSLLADPANAMANASKRLKDIRLAKGQKVRDFREAIEQLERDIPEQTKEVRDAWSFLNSLSPDLRREVLREQKTITSRDQISASAQRFEELAEMEARRKPEEKEKESSNSKPKDTPASGKRGAGKGRAKGSSSSTDKSKASKSLECFNCGKLGHKAAECRSAPKAAKPEEKEKDKESKKAKPKS